MYKGHTNNYMLVQCESDENLENKIVSVMCKEAEVEYVNGIVIDT